MTMTNLNDTKTVDDHADGVMVALLPMTTDWCKIEVPHMTLVYAGKTTELKPSVFNELAKDACSLAQITNPISLKVMGVEVGGDEEKVNVLRLRPSPELWGMRRFLERWNESQFPFKPHATIGPLGVVDVVPYSLAFDRIMVGWGSDYITFWLKR